MSKYPKLKFRVNEFEEGSSGEFAWGEKRYDLFDKFYDSEEILEITIAINALKEIINEDPEFIDAYNSLGWLESDEYNYGNALSYFMKGYKIGNKLIPAKFKGQIVWGWTANRPFLRAMHGLGMVYINMKEFGKASNIFKKMLKYNPSDNQGVRALIIECYIAQGKFKSILSVCNMFPGDCLPDTLYGSVLAYYKLEKFKLAEKKLEIAIGILPNVAKELIKKKHKNIESKYPDSVTVGGEDEAYEYWERVGQYWTDTKILKSIEKGL